MTGELGLRFAAVVVTCILHLIVQAVGLSVLTGLAMLALPRLGSHLSMSYLTMFAILTFANCLLAWLLVSAMPTRRTGATLGMKWFGLVVRSASNKMPSIIEVTKREVLLILLAISVIGLPLAWIFAFFNHEGLTWWDRFSGTKVVVVPARIELINEARRRAQEGPSQS